MKLIADSHLDLAWNALQLNRDLTLPLGELNEREVGSTDFPGRSRATVSLPEMRAGRVHFCLGTLVAGASSRGGAQRFSFSSVDIANSLALAQWNYYRRLEAQHEARLILSTEDLLSHIATWKEAAPQQTTLPIGIIIAFEGCDAISDPSETEMWYERGLRCASLVHYGEGRYSGGTGTNSPLTALGHELLTQFERLGIVLDVTHLSDRAFWEVLDCYDGPILASHQNCRALVPCERQFEDTQIRRVIDRNGVIGVACDAWMLSQDWPAQSPGKPTPPRSSVPMTTLVDHIDHICQLAGTVQHVAVGSDLDGGFGREQTPEGLDSIADLQRLDDLLARRGYSDGDIEQILSGNWTRFFAEHLPKQ